MTHPLIPPVANTPPPPPPPGGVSRELTADQKLRACALDYAAGIVGQVAAADARERGGLDWEEIADEALRMAERFQRYIRAGETEVTS